MRGSGKKRKRLSLESLLYCVAKFTAQRFPSCICDLQGQPWLALHLFLFIICFKVVRSALRMTDLRWLGDTFLGVWYSLYFTCVTYDNENAVLSLETRSFSLVNRLDELFSSIFYVTMPKMKGRGHRDIILRHIACVLQRRNVETQFLVGIVRGGISVLRRQSERPSSRSGVVFLSALETNDSYFYEI